MNPKLAHEEATLDLSAKGIWQPLPGETPSSYALFCAYLELGEHPTLQKVADKTGKSLSSICRLSARHHWLERATAYRQHLSHTLLVATQQHHTRQTELCRLREQLFRQQMWEAAQIIGLACHQAIEKLLTNPNADVEPYELVRLFDLYQKLGSRANAATGFTTEGPEPPSPEWDQAVRQVYGRSFSLEELAHLLQHAALPKALPLPQPASTPESPSSHDS
jgi:hypothetical protein